MKRARQSGRARCVVEVYRALQTTYRSTFLLNPPANAARATHPKPTSSAVNALFTATSTWPRNSAAMTCAHAAPDGDFRHCCLRHGKYDGANRHDYFRK